MTKVIFYFAGTGDDGQGYSWLKERNSTHHDDVIRVYIAGCQDRNVGGSYLFPELDLAANNVRSAFNEEGKLDRVKLRANFGLGHGLYSIVDRRKVDDLQPVEVASIALEGFSRRAMTTFASAKKLDDLNIKIDIISKTSI